MSARQKVVLGMFLGYCLMVAVPATALAVTGEGDNAAGVAVMGGLFGLFLGIVCLAVGTE